jgi:hypothetical protein
MMEAEIMANLMDGGIERLGLIDVSAQGIGFQIGVVQLSRVGPESPAARQAGLGDIDDLMC